MAVNCDEEISAKDRDVLRNLAERLAVQAADPVMAERRRLWKAQSICRGERPMLLMEPGPLFGELIPAEEVKCEGEWARNHERSLLIRLFNAEQVRDDTVVEPRVYYTPVVHRGNYGVEAAERRGASEHGFGSKVWEAPLKKLSEGVHKLHFREFTFDEEATLREKTRLESVFGGLLAVAPHGSYWWSLGLTIEAVVLVGLEALMLKMYDEPEGLHAVMAFLRDEHMHMLDWFESQGLLTLNNDDAYVGSGSVGYTDALPQPDYVPGSPARLKDLWALSESQETVYVSPEQFAEFVFPYQLPVISRFGLSYYGCCEPLEGRWDIIKQIPNLRRVSVSPWSNQEKMAEQLGREYIFCRKPNPAHISTKWKEDVIREDLRHTLELTQGLTVEIVMKDVHTLAGEGWRLGRWVEIAREEIDRAQG